MIFANLHSGVQKRPIERARRIMQQYVLDPALQQEHDPHPARDGVRERAPETPSRKEVCAGDYDLLARLSDEMEVSVLDVAAMAHAVPHHERNALPARIRPRRVRRGGNAFSGKGRETVGA